MTNRLNQGERDRIPSSSLRRPHRCPGCNVVVDPGRDRKDGGGPAFCGMLECIAKTIEEGWARKGCKAKTRIVRETTVDSHGCSVSWKAVRIVSVTWPSGKTICFEKR